RRLRLALDLPRERPRDRPRARPGAAAAARRGAGRGPALRPAGRRAAARVAGDAGARRDGLAGPRGARRRPVRVGRLRARVGGVVLAPRQARRPAGPEPRPPLPPRVPRGRTHRDVLEHDDVHGLPGRAAVRRRRPRLAARPGRPAAGRDVGADDAAGPRRRLAGGQVRSAPARPGRMRDRRPRRGSPHGDRRRLVTRPPAPAARGRGRRHGALLRPDAHGGAAGRRQARGGTGRGALLDHALPGQHRLLGRHRRGARRRRVGAAVPAPVRPAGRGRRRRRSDVIAPARWSGRRPDGGCRQGPGLTALSRHHARETTAATTTRGEAARTADRERALSRLGAAPRHGRVPGRILVVTTAPGPRRAGERTEEVGVGFLETLLGVVVTAVLLYLAFIVGGFVLRILLGLVAIAVVVFVLMRLFGGGRRGRGPY